MADKSAHTVKSSEPVEEARRLFCFSDIHGNLPALIAVYNHALADRRMDESKGDRVVIPGDLINYGGTPGAVIDFCRTAFKDPVILMGNHENYAHDVAHDGKVEDVGNITEDTLAHGVVLNGIERTLELLTSEQKKFVKNITKMSHIYNGRFMVSHTVPKSLEEYVFPNTDVSAILEQEPNTNFIMGHSHIASVFAHPKGDGPMWKYNPDAEWDEQLGQDWRTSDEVTKVRIDVADVRNFLVVCPAVGKPRADDCNKAGYAVVDFVEQDVGLFRIPYDYERAANDIIANGMPEIFAEHIRSAR